MQMFGIGILEIMVVLVLAVLVVGPERLPQVSGELAQWIRRGRAYARHLTQDFNEVVKELEQEVGASKEDWQEIAEVVSDQAEDVEKELKSTQGELKAIEREEARREAQRAAAAAGNGASDEPAAARAEAVPAAEKAVASGEEAAVPPVDAADAEGDSAEERGEGEEKPWFVPEQAGRRRSRE